MAERKERKRTLEGKPPPKGRAVVSILNRAVEIRDGKIAIPDRPGLGIELDRGAIEAANALYRQYGLGARDDALAMQFLIPGWTFDDKRPCLVR